MRDPFFRRNPLPGDFLATEKFSGVEQARFGGMGGRCWRLGTAASLIGSVGTTGGFVGQGDAGAGTTDDSWAATISAQDPSLKGEDIAQHPMRNVLTNVLSGRPTVDVHLSERVLLGGERLLLCSDGVHGVLEADDLRDLLGSVAGEEDAAQRIVRMALDNGSRDNATALVIGYEADK